jgi:predicted dehydrogenase
MRDLRFALIGAGFWAEYQLAAWHELPGARCVAVCDIQRSKAERLAIRFGIASAHEDIRELLAPQSLDFIDIATDVDSHAPLAMQAMEQGVAVICQKPLAATLQQARTLCRAAEAASVPLLVHENWRWQAPIRRMKAILDSGELGTLVRARIDFANSFSVFDNQPFLKTLERFILSDVGTHILDVSRFLFGEATDLYCQTRRMRADIAGEDVATVIMRKQNGLTVTCNMSYASRWEYDRFPQTMIAVEGTRAGVSLGPDYEVNLFTAHGKQVEHVAIPTYPWAHPEYALIHASVVDCQRNLLAALRRELLAETTGDDNLQTLALVDAAYESARSGTAVRVSSFT